MLVPGLSTQKKIIIQNKIDTILNNEYYSTCNKFIKQINKFNEKLTKNFTHEKMSKLNAKLSKNIYLKRYPQNKLKQLLNIDINNSEIEHVKKLIYKTFTLSELLILYNNLDYFIKDEKIRSIFPILNKNKIESLYSKEMSDKTPIAIIKKNIKLISPISRDINLNKKNSNYLDNKEKINKILLEYNKRIIEEKKINYNNELKNIEQQNYFQKTLKKLKYNINNISKITNSKNFSFEHPLVNYYYEKKKNIQKTNINSYKNNSISLCKNKLKNKYKFKNLLKQNKKTLSFIKNIEENLITKRIKEKDENQKKLKQITIITNRFNNHFKRKLYLLRGNRSSYDFNIRDETDKIIILDKGKEFNSIF